MSWVGHLIISQQLSLELLLSVTGLIQTSRHAKLMSSNIKCAFIYSILKYWPKVFIFVKLLHYQGSANL